MNGARRADGGLDLGEGRVGHGEADGDRIDLVDQHQAVGVRRAHQIARIHPAGPGASGQRRRDAGVVELDARGLDLGLVGLDRRLQHRHLGALGIQGLAVDGAVARQFDVAGEVLAGIVQLRLVARPLGQGLGQLGLLHPVVEPRDELPFMHDLAFAEAHRFQLAVDARAYRHAGPGLDRAQPLEADGHVAHGHVRRMHQDRRRGVAVGRGGHRSRTARPPSPCTQDQQRRQAPPQKRTAHGGNRHESSKRDDRQEGLRRVAAPAERAATRPLVEYTRKCQCALPRMTRG